MGTTPVGSTPPKRRPGPKPRTVVPLTITVTHAQRAELEARADTERTSISTLVRRFVAAGLVAGVLFGLFTFTALIEIMLTSRNGEHRTRRSRRPASRQ